MNVYFVDKSCEQNKQSVVTHTVTVSQCCDLLIMIMMIMICFDLEAYWAYMSIYTFQIRA